VRAAANRLFCLWACAAACTAAAAPLDTLFHTPQEREQLDRIRRGEPIATAPVPQAPVRRREITGYVKRSDGRATAFIDGVPVPVDSPRSPLLEPDAVRSPGGGRGSEIRIERKDAR
jgi:hypothetical protein